MMENTAIYLLKCKKNIKDDKEMYQFIKKSFPKIHAMPVKNSYFFFSFSMLAHMCYPITLNGIAAVLGNCLAGRPKIMRLIDRGLLKTYRMPIADMGSRVAYYLTPAGNDALSATFPWGMGNKQKLRRTGGVLPAHDYGVGLSLLQCLLRETPFSYHKELVYSSGLFKEKGALCVDAVVTFQDKENTTLYIEQDMGTESPGTVASKLQQYASFGLLGKDSNHLIISSHSLSDTSCPSYNISALSDLLKEMKSVGVDKAYSYYASYGSVLSERLKSCLRALLVRTGICTSYDHTGNLLSANQLSKDCVLERDLQVADFTIDDLSSYILSLKDGTNIYRAVDYNRYQLTIAHGKLEQMAEYIFRRISLSQYHRGEVYSMLNGYSCYVLPTVLMSNYFDTILNENQDDLRLLLTTYFPEIDKERYHLVSREFTPDGFPGFHLRNCYDLSDNRYVCIENVGKDLGGYVRALYLNSMKNNGMIADIHLVCVCDTEEEAMSLAKFMDYFPKDNKIDLKGISYSFLLSEDIKNGGALRVPCRLGGGGLIRIETFGLSPTPKTILEDNLANLSMEELMELVK